MANSFFDKIKSKISSLRGGSDDEYEEYEDEEYEDDEDDVEIDLDQNEDSIDESDSFDEATSTDVKIPTKEDFDSTPNDAPVINAIDPDTGTKSSIDLKQFNASSQDSQSDDSGLYEYDDDEDDDDDEEEQGFLAKNFPFIMKLINRKKNDDDDEADEGDEGDEDEDEDEDDEEAKKKKKNSNLIKIVALIAVAYMAIDEFFLKEDPDVAPEVPAVTRPKRKPRVKKKKVETKPAVEKNEEVVETPPVDQPKVDSANNEVVAQPEPEIQVAEPAPKPEPAPEVVSQPEPVKEVTEQKDIQADPSVGEKIEPAKETTIVEPEISVTPSVDKSDNVQGSQDTSSTSLDSQLDKIVTRIEQDKKEIDQRVEYTKPPNYESFGRGLVYNCKGKHWACVDRKSYEDCEKNFLWSRQESKTSECATSKVLASEYDCRQLQKHYINTVEKAPNCN